MTKEEREEQVLQAMSLGRILPLWGVVAGQDGKFSCECGTDCGRDAGKHPRMKRKLATLATDDPAKVRGWLANYPFANFAVYTGERCIVVDADVRPGEPSGRASLEYLEIDNGNRIPDTVMVLSGRNNGSCHLYFNTPPNFGLNSRNGFLPGVDMKAHRQYVVAPGSRHITGGYYRFAEECRPDEQTLADVPDFLLQEIMATASAMLIPGTQTTHSASIEPTTWEELPDPGTLRSDKIVLGALLHDKVAGPLYRGQLRFPHDLSRNDLALADKLTFYCCHNFDQVLRLFIGSGLYRDRFMLPVKKDWTYAQWTLRRAFLNNPNNWIPKPRKSRGKGAKKGRKLSDTTAAILLVNDLYPDWKPTRIASEMEIKPGTVRRVLHNLRQGRYERYTKRDTNTQIIIESENTVESVGLNPFGLVQDPFQGTHSDLDGHLLGIRMDHLELVSTIVHV